MSQDNLTNNAPQFDTAEFSGKPGPDRCKTCGQLISSSYFRVNGALACPVCAETAKRQIPTDTHGTFVRGLLFGAGGAILGLIVYAAFGILTGLMIGYVSLAVGYIVGKAIMMGSKGIGGRRYQVAAVLFTYAAVSMAAIPIGISQIVKEKKVQKPKVENVRPSSTPSAQDPQGTKESSTQDEQSGNTPKMGFGAALGYLALVGLASPFLELQDPVHGLIGLVILLVGIRIAWRMTAGKPTEIIGPFNSTTPASA